MKSFQSHHMQPEVIQITEHNLLTHVALLPHKPQLVLDQLRHQLHPHRCNQVEQSLCQLQLAGA